MATTALDDATIKQYIKTATDTHEDFKIQAWNDCEFADGDQWSSLDIDKFKDKGVNPLTINKIFPILNRVVGHYVNNQVDVIAKGRNPQDAEIAQTMSEAIMYVRDKNKTPAIVTRMANDLLRTGIGVIKTNINPDPNKEIIQHKYIPWYQFNWDPSGSPDLNLLTTRYCFISPYVNKADLKLMFPHAATAIDKVAYELSTNQSYIEQLIEQYNTEYLSSLSDAVPDDRVQVHEVWYQVLEEDERLIEGQWFRTVTPKMFVATVVGDLVLQNIPTPYDHNEFPFSVAVGYLDRFNKPYGIIRQGKDQNIEVNKRRSMALALLSNRRVYVEEGAVEDINTFYAEANRLDGLILTKPNKLDRVNIEELANLSSGQMNLMNQASADLKETLGIVDELGKTRSGAALEEQYQQTTVNFAELFTNLNTALLSLGSLTCSMIQQYWKAGKIFRVTDRMSGAEKFVEVNTGPHNRLDEAEFDLVLSINPLTDTMRAKYLDTIYGAIQKAPPEAIAPLFSLALELTELPNKEQALDQIREATGVDPLDYKLTKEERQAKLHEKAKAKEEHEQMLQQKELQKLDLELAQEEAKKAKLEAEAYAARVIAEAKAEDVAQKGYQIGAQVEQMLKSGITPKKEKGENNDPAARGSVREES